MRLKLTLLLAFLNLIAFGTIYYLENTDDDSTEKRPPEPVLSSSITGSTRIEITGEAVPERRVLAREGEAWSLREPVVWPANPSAIDRIFRALLFLRKDIRFTMADVERNNQSLADYGLDTPALALTFERDGTPTTIRIGAPTDVGERFYLLGPSGEEIFVIDQEVVRSVALDLQDLRRNTLFGMDFFSVKEMTLQPGNGRNLQIRLAAVEDGWVFEAPIQTRASAPAVDARLQEILETRLLSLRPESQIPPTESGVLEPRLRVSLDDGGNRRTFLLGSPVPDREDVAYGKMEGFPTIVTVPAEPFLALGDAQTRLREKSFFLFRLPAVTSVDISSPTRTVSLQKLENDSWRVKAEGEDLDPVGYPADPGEISRTFEELVTLRALRFVSDAPSDSDLRTYGLDKPQRVVEVVGQETRRLLLGDLDVESKTVYAKVAEDPFVYAVPLDVVRNLPVSPLAYRDRLLERLPQAARIRAIRVTDLESGETLLDRALGEDGRSWTAESDETGGVVANEEENRAFARVLEQLRSFRVESYLSPAFTPGFRIDEDRIVPWRYALEADILLPGGEEAAEETRRYVLTERIEGTLQGGGSEEKDVTFTLPQDLIDAWSALFPERPLPEVYDAEAALEAATAPDQTNEKSEDPDQPPETPETAEAPEPEEKQERETEPVEPEPAPE